MPSPSGSVIGTSGLPPQSVIAPTIPMVWFSKYVSISPASKASRAETDTAAIELTIAAIRAMPIIFFLYIVIVLLITKIKTF